MKAATYGPCSSCGCDADRTATALCRLCFELRDRFAAVALGALISVTRAEGCAESDARLAYGFADAMLAARGGAR